MTDNEHPAISRELLEGLSRVGFKHIQTLGYHLQPNDFYTPLNDCSFLEGNRDLWAHPHPALEIRWDPERQMKVAEEVSAFVDELVDVPVNSTRLDEFCWNNDFWNNADALVQYGLVRSRQPRRYVEIGCGWSSVLLARALARNGRRCIVNMIDPYASERRLAALPRDWTRHKTILQRAPLELFDGLTAGDVLFYDGSHCAKTASDVNWFFFRVLPRLRPGVLIHLHDIFLPVDYPEEWLLERGQTWNEQYVLQAFLMHNTAYRIVIANQYLFHYDAARLERLYKNVQPPYGCSFWMEKRTGE